MAREVIEVIKDDITGQTGAIPRWLLLMDGSTIQVLEIDLMPPGFKALLEKYNGALAKYLSAGRVRRVKATEARALFADLLGVDPVESARDTPPVESARTELPPAGQTKRELAKAAAKKAPVPAKTPANRVPRKRGERQVLAQPPTSVEATKFVAEGVNLAPYQLRRISRPGIKEWWQANGPLLQLKPFANGRIPVEVEAAFDRYQGKPVSFDSLHPMDEERLTTPTPEPDSGHRPPVAVFSDQKG